MGVIHVSKPSDLPPGDHFAILKFSSITIPGDERSRTNPGHGYPEYTQTTISCTVYPTREAWTKEVESLSAQKYGGNDWVATILKVPTLKATFTFDIT